MIKQSPSPWSLIKEEGFVKDFLSIIDADGVGIVYDSINPAFDPEDYKRSLEAMTLMSKAPEMVRLVGDLIGLIDDTSKVLDVPYIKEDSVYLRAAKFLESMERL